MHICTVVPNYLPHFGGAEVGVHQVLSHLARTTTHRFSVITAVTDATLPAYEIMDGVEVYRYVRPNVWLKWFAPTAFGFLRNPALIHQLKPDVLHLSYLLPSGLSAWHLARRQGIPTVLLLGGNDIYDPFDMPPAILRRWVAYAVKRSPMIAVNSTWSKQYLVAHYGAHESAIHVTGFGIDSARFHPDLDGRVIRERYGVAPHTVLIFALQRLEMRKGLDVLLRAVALLGDRDFHLLIGGKGRDAAQLQALTAELGLTERVTFAGFVDETEKALYYAACDIFALHSHHEGLGIVLAEAAAVGKPLVTTHAGGTTDIARNGQTGLTVPPSNPQALAQALAVLIDDPQQRHVMGHASAQHAQTMAIERVAAHYLQLFETVYPSPVHS